MLQNLVMQVCSPYGMKIIASLYFPSPMGNTYHMLSFSFTKFTIIDKMSILVTL